MSQKARRMTFLGRHAVLCSLLLCLGSTVAVLGVADRYFAWKAKARRAEATGPPYWSVVVRYPNLWDHDPEHGRVLGRNQRVHALSVSSSRIIYDYQCTLDEHRRRSTPVENTEGRDKFMAFLGCSFAFGEGVEDDDTLPAYMARLAPEYMPYNYGAPGAGPQDVYIRVNRIDWENEIPEETGIFIYVYIADHINRAIGSMHVLNAWVKHSPCIRFDESGNVVNMGTFQEARPRLCRFYHLMGKSGFVQYFGMTYPIQPREKDYHFVARLIAETKRECLEHRPNSRFVVAVYPFNFDTGRIRSHLSEYDIECIDLHSALAHTLRQLPHRGQLLDTHPAPATHAHCAEALAQELALSPASPSQVCALP